MKKIKSACKLQMSPDNRRDEQRVSRDVGSRNAAGNTWQQEQINTWTTYSQFALLLLSIAQSDL
jgi:hypothetical protein